MKAYLFLGVLLIASLTPVDALNGYKQPLVDRSRVIGPVNEDKQYWMWLSDKDLLVVTTDRKPDNLMGKVTEEIHAGME